MARSIMAPATFERVLAEVGRHVPPIRVAVLYHGGEPFLNKNFLTMARRVKDLGIPFVKTVSNGMVIRKEMYGAVIDSGLDAIEISIDGDSAAASDAIRRRSNATRILATIRGLAAANAARGNPIRVFVSTTQFQTRETFAPEAEAPVPAYLRREFADLAGQVEFKSTWAMVWPATPPGAGYDVLHDDVSPRAPSRCSLLEDTMTIRADGTVVACCFDLLTRSNLGNILKQPLADIWNGPALQRFRRDFAARRYPAPCDSCAVVTGFKYLLRNPDSIAPREERLSERLRSAARERATTA